MIGEDRDIEKMILLAFKRMTFISLIISLILSISFFFTIHTPHLALNILLWYIGTCFGIYMSPKIYYKIWKY